MRWKRKVTLSWWHLMALSRPWNGLFKFQFKTASKEAVLLMILIVFVSRIFQGNAGSGTTLGCGLGRRVIRAPIIENWNFGWRRAHLEVRMSLLFSLLFLSAEYWVSAVTKGVIEFVWVSTVDSLRRRHLPLQGVLITLALWLIALHEWKDVQRAVRYSNGDVSIRFVLYYWTQSFIMDYHLILKQLLSGVLQWGSLECYRRRLGERVSWRHAQVSWRSSVKRCLIQNIHTCINAKLSTGLSTDTAIHSIACKRIAGRSFPPLEVKTANDEKKEVRPTVNCSRKAHWLTLATALYKQSMAGDMDKLEKENEQLQSKLKEMEEKAAARYQYAGVQLLQPNMCTAKRTEGPRVEEMDGRPKEEVCPNSLWRIEGGCYGDWEAECPTGEYSSFVLGFGWNCIIRRRWGSKWRKRKCAWMKQRRYILVEENLFKT